MLTCPRCGAVVTNSAMTVCTRCGLQFAEHPPVLAQPQQPSPPSFSPPGAPGAPGSSGYGGYGAPSQSFGNQPPSYQPPTYGAPSYQPPSYQPPNYEQPSYQQPGYQQPGYQQPGYQQPTYPQAPYGQPAAPSGYQQPGMYGPPSMAPNPNGPMGFPPPAPPQRGGAGRTIAIVVSVVLVLAILGGAGFVFLSRTSGKQSTSTGGPSTSAPQVYFQDALTSKHNAWLDDGVNCYFRADGYHVNGSYVCYAPAGSFGDAITSTQVKQLSGTTNNGYGLVFRRTSIGNFYEFGIDGNGKWYMGKAVNGQYTAIQDFTVSSSIHPNLNTLNTIAVKAQGSNFTFYANDTVIGTASDATFTSGKSGVAGGDSIEVVFTNFKITAVS